MKTLHSTSYEKRFKSPQWRVVVVCLLQKPHLPPCLLFLPQSIHRTPLFFQPYWYTDKHHSFILPCRPLNEMTSRHSSLPYFQQQPLAGQFPQQPPTSSFLSPNSTAAAAPDHIPLTMRDDTNGFATGTTRSSDSFRQRHFKRPNETDDPFDDVDLSMDYDSKIFKARQRKAIADSKARKRDWRISLALTAWALYIRLWRISQPSSVV